MRSKVYLFIGCFLAFGILGAILTNYVSHQFSAKIHFETEHNVGTVSPDSLVETLLQVENKGTAELVLTNFKPSCSCTLPVEAETRIAPYSKGGIKVRIRVRPSTTGQLKEQIAFQTNDPARPRALINIVGKVFDAVTISPERLIFFGDQPPRTAVHREIRVKSYLGEIVSIEPVAEVDFIKMTVKSITGEDALIGVTITPPFPSGELDLLQSIHVKTGGELISKRIVVGGFLNSDRTAKPSVLTFGKAYNNVQIINLDNTDGPVVVSATLYPVDETSRQFSVSIKAPASVQVAVNDMGQRLGFPLNWQGTIIMSDADQTPVLSVPLYVTSDRNH